MILSDRLKVIADKVPPGSRVADIGTDHGFIPVYLVRNNIVSKVIASDISRGSLEKTINLVKEQGLSNVIETRLGSGLKVLKAGEVDTVIIAGMGGLLIKNILEESPDILQEVKTLILQPMNFQSELRRWLIQNSFTIKDEELVIDNGRIYEIMLVEHGEQEEWNDVELEISPRLLEKKHRLLEPFILKKISIMENIISKLDDNNTENATKKRKHCEEKLKKYKEVYQWTVQWKE